MIVYQALRAGLRSLFLVVLYGCQSTPAKLPPGVSPVQATWLYGRYIIPAAYVTRDSAATVQQDVDEPRWPDVASPMIKPGVSVPVVVYLHGCNGMRRQAENFSKLLVSEGYAVFMPDSFKRPGRKECSAQGKLRERVALRTEEVEYALEQIAQLPWVDQSRLVLMGFSEGGNTTDNWSRGGFAGHIIIGSACTLVGGEPAAPRGTPVLAVVGANDSYRPGKFCRIDESDGVSRSIVIAGADHWVSKYAETQEAIRSFLRKCCSGRR